MTITASQVKELRELTGAGMMECKKALTEAGGDLEAAKDLLRKSGQALADKKAGRIAAEGVIVYLVNDSGNDAVIMEVNCETDFVAKDANFVAFSQQVCEIALRHQPADVASLMELETAAGPTLESTRQELVTKIGEKIDVRRFHLVTPKGSLGCYLHGARIGVLVDVEGDASGELSKDMAMHIAATNPQFVSADDVAPEVLDKERKFLTEQAEEEGKPPEIVAKMIDGRLRKFLGEITLEGQAFVKDPDIKVGKLLKKQSAKVCSFVRLEVGEGIEKKVENFAEEVAAQVEASRRDDGQE